MRRALLLLAGGALLSLTAATSPPAPPAATDETATNAEVVTDTTPVVNDAGAEHLLIAGEAAASVEVEPVTGSDAAAAQPVPVTAYARDLAAARQVFKQRLAELTAAFLQEKDATRSLALQREIQQLKLDAELGNLELQARHARLAGKTDLADQADALAQRLRQAMGTPAPAATSPSSDDAAAGAQH